MVIFGIILASMVPKCSIIRYLRCHLGFYGILWCHFGIFWSKSRARIALASLVYNFCHFGIFDIFDIFGILASWDSKVDIIREQRCLEFGIFALSWCLLLSLMMLKCPKCQKKKSCQNQKMNESHFMISSQYEKSLIKSWGNFLESFPT